MVIMLYLNFPLGLIKYLSIIFSHLNNKELYCRATNVTCFAVRLCDPLSIQGKSQNLGENTLWLEMDMAVQETYITVGYCFCSSFISCFV